MTGQRVKNQWTRVRQDCLRITESENSSNAATFTSFTRNLDGEFDQRFQTLFFAPTEAGTDCLECYL
jgi:hypothetical protein